MAVREIFKTMESNTRHSTITIPNPHAGSTPSFRTYKLFTIEPLRQPHTSTFILLHGSGDNPVTFGSMFLATKLPPATSTTTSNPSPSSSSSSSLDPRLVISAFPHTRFIFPGAPTRTMARWAPAQLTRWFDWWSVDGQYNENGRGRRDDVQADGLRESVALVHELVRREAEGLKGRGGTGSVMLGGLSNGCAAALASLMLWEGERMAGCLGMCGWLPYAGRVGKLVGTEMGGGSGSGGAESEDQIVDEVEGGAGASQVADEEVEEKEREGGEGEDRKLRQAQERLEQVRAWLNAEISMPPAGDDNGQSSTQQQQQQQQQPEEQPFQTQQRQQSPSQPPKTPVFLGHGSNDPTIPVARPGEAATALRRMGFDVTSKIYPGLAHWYSKEMLEDFVAVLEGEWAGFGA